MKTRRATTPKLPAFPLLSEEVQKKFVEIMEIIEEIKTVDKCEKAIQLAFSEKCTRQERKTSECQQAFLEASCCIFREFHLPSKKIPSTSIPN